MTISLLNEVSLDFYRPTGKEYFVAGQPVKSPVEPIRDVRGSLHPYKEGKRTRNLPEGKTSRDAWIFRTTQDLRTTDPFGKYEADFTEYEGNTYYVYDVESWKTQFLNARHCKVILVRRDQMLGTE